MTSRLTLNEDGRNIDEYLEICFRQVFDWHVEGEQGPAIETLLDQYGTSVWGKSAVSCVGAVNDINKAILWVTQFGELRIEKVTANTLETLRKHNEGYNSEINFSGKIGPDKKGQKRVYARTAHQVVLLAGIQVLRETADTLLNSAETTKHH